MGITQTIKRMLGLSSGSNDDRVDPSNTNRDQIGDQKTSGAGASRNSEEWKNDNTTSAFGSKTSQGDISGRRSPTGQGIGPTDHTGQRKTTGSTQVGKNADAAPPSGDVGALGGRNLKDLTGTSTGASAGDQQKNSNNQPGVHLGRSGTDSSSVSGHGKNQRKEGHGHHHVSDALSDPDQTHENQTHGSNTSNAAEDASHDSKQLDPATQERARPPEREEIMRHREHDRHAHQDQHHRQPVVDEDENVGPEKHPTKVQPITNIRERHSSKDGISDEQVRGPRDSVENSPKERNVVDKGEKITELEKHHVHNIVQPVIDKQTISPNTIHTTIPIQHTTHDAPIIHEPQTHATVSVEDFLRKGGRLEGGLNREDVRAKVMHEGEYTREISGDEGRRGQAGFSGENVGRWGGEDRGRGVQESYDGGTGVPVREAHPSRSGKQQLNAMEGENGLDVHGTSTHSGSRNPFTNDRDVRGGGKDGEL